MSVDKLNSQLDYEKSKEMAKSADPAVRAKLAAQKNLPPEILYFLAEDSDAEVRRQVANNEAAPELTHSILAKDEADGVRSQLAIKIAKLLKTPAADIPEKSRQMSHDALARLAGDQITAVRRALSEAIKDIPGAPADLILQIAGDAESVVAGPVLEHSPVLSDADLVRIIEAPASEGARTYISKRKGVNEIVSEAIVATDDISAIGELLGNSSAQIQETTLDRLVDRAEEIELWQAPLVSRPSLPKTATARLAQFVAANLLDELQQRSDIDEAMKEDVKRVIRERLDGAEFALETDEEMPVAAQDFLKLAPPVSMVQRLFDSRRLNAEMISRSLDAADYSFVLAALMVNSKIDLKIVQRIFTDKSAKGIVAVCRLSGIPVGLIIKIQQRMGRVPPNDVLKPVDGDYPLSQEEAEWQIEFHAKIVDRMP
ncbi:MAG: DUF2336 domain-containing protein [Sphingomonadales bacterium]|nr:DUF2336 domain-containing protein [Sphingomonadales bacterium]